MITEHPEDIAARDRIARRLRWIRTNRNIAQWALADALNITESGASDLEERRSWMIPTLQAWARVLGYRIDLSIDGLEVPDDGDSLAAFYNAQQPSTEAAEDQLDLRILINDLTRIRRAQGLTLAQLGALLGCSESGAWRRENEPDRHRLATVQNHVRTLGGVLVVDLAYLTSGVAA